jgi:hypothetical protein
MRNAVLILKLSSIFRQYSSRVSKGEDRGESWGCL